MKPTILIVDDEKLLLSSLERALSGDGYNALTAKNGKDALAFFEKHNPDIVLLDVKLPDIDGMHLLRKIKEIDMHCPVIMMTAYSGIRGAVEAIKLGAYDYIAKPFDIEELKFAIARCLESQRAMVEVNEIRSKKKERFSFEKILTRNTEMKDIIRLAKRIAVNDKSTVLISGESGTGKELFANAIHYNGPRLNDPFITVNCAALSEGILESELFGHEKGAFTGAVKQKKGLFELADKGTLFLDEIGEISHKTQVRLLRFLEERNFQRVGGTENIDVDVRIVTATNKDLLEEVSKGNFREDLYYRLNVISIHLPPLCERKDDIPLLVERLIMNYRITLNKTTQTCNDEVLRILMDYDWPGNIRELRNIIERTVLLSENEIITPSDLPLEIVNHNVSIGTAKIQHLDPMSLDTLIKLYAESMLARSGNNKSQTAGALGITRQRLKRILRS
ncbi:MAG TPA: sigma-54-dependent Fis family transcriptional regulator [Deltaproteobacteria bacterium]|nr:sigma-54-dependent Fis family transcriptional regulator [Deltaproteobacteria bacterium]